MGNRLIRNFVYLDEVGVIDFNWNNRWISMKLRPGKSIFHTKQRTMLSFNYHAGEME